MYRDKAIEKMYEKQIDLLQKNKKDLQLRVEQIIETDEILKKKFNNIGKIKGLGLQSLAVIVAETNGGCCAGGEGWSSSNIKIFSPL